MRLILVRHGDSLHAQRHIVAGQTGCPGLSPLGFTQAQALAERLQQRGEFDDCHVLVSSPWLRARQTADALSAALRVHDVCEDNDLREVEPGEADGLTREICEERFGVFDPVTFPERPFAPGGESWVQFVARVHATHERFARDYAGRTVVAVTHAGFIVVSLLTLFGIPRPGTGARFEPKHTAITEWRVDGAWTLERYNDASHLPDLAGC